MPIIWEEIHRTDFGDNVSNIVTERAQVLGGWLVRVYHVDYRGGLYGAGGVTFVPDSLYEWQVS